MYKPDTIIFLWVCRLWRKQNCHTNQVSAVWEGPFIQLNSYVAHYHKLTRHTRAYTCVCRRQRQSLSSALGTITACKWLACHYILLHEWQWVLQGPLLAYTQQYISREYMGHSQIQHHYVLAIQWYRPMVSSIYILWYFFTENLKTLCSLYEGCHTPRVPITWDKLLLCFNTVTKNIYILYALTHAHYSSRLESDVPLNDEGKVVS